MKTCGTCIHFGGKIESYEFDDDGNERPETQMYHRGDLIKHMNGSPRQYGGVAGVTDGSGYHATFCVTDEFGCNQWAGG